jgi:hypothetical protein
MPKKDDNAWMNDQLRARARGTVIRSDEGGEQIAAELRRYAPSYDPSTDRNPRTAPPVGPEPQTQSVGDYRRWLYQHASNLDSQGRLPGESGYNPRTVGERDSFELLAERVRRWRDANRPAS